MSTPGRPKRWPVAGAAFLLAVISAGSALEARAAAAEPSDVESLIARVEAPRLTSEAGGEGVDAGTGELSARHAGLSLAELLADTGTPGLSVAVFRDGRLLWARAWGVADRETGRAVRTDTPFQAASISKPVAATAVMLAVERGLFTLDTPIGEVLKRYRLPDNEWTAKRAVTPRLLLSHTAGTTVHGFPGYEVTAALPDAVAVLEGKGNTAPIVVDIEPGTVERYSGGGTTLLQVGLEDVTGEPFAKLMKRWVLVPAGMADSAYQQPPSGKREKRAARAHTWPDGVAGAGQVPPGTPSERRESPFHVYPELAAAGLWTTPSDLCRFALAIQQSLRGGDQGLISQESARAMTTPAAHSTFGMGFEMQDRGEGDGPAVWYFGHTGGNWGFRSYLLASRDGRYGAAAMVNGDSFDILIEVMLRLATVHEWQGDFLRPPRNRPPA